MNKNKTVRNGDVVLHSIKELPEGLKKVKNDGSFVLALGETTGHKHTLVAERMEVFQDAQGRFYFEVKGSAKVTHEEHKTLTVLPGIYRQGAEREMDHFSHAVRKVID